MGEKRLEIRAIRPEEGPLLRAVRLSALAEAPDAFAERYDDAVSKGAEHWDRLATLDAAGIDATCVFAFAGGEPVGMAVGSVDSDDPKARHLAAMWVAPAARGGEAAGRLLDAVVSWARGRGATTVLAGVTRGNDRATAFYRRRGFRDADPRRPRPGHLAGCEIVLELPLDAT